MKAASIVESAYVDDPITVASLRVQTTSYISAAAPDRPKAKKTK
jgi:hypothetical protein